MKNIFLLMTHAGCGGVLILGEEGRAAMMIEGCTNHSLKLLFFLRFFDFGAQDTSFLTQTDLDKNKTAPCYQTSRSHMASVYTTISCRKKVVYFRRFWTKGLHLSETIFGRKVLPLLLLLSSCSTCQRVRSPLTTPKYKNFSRTSCIIMANNSSLRLSYYSTMFLTTQHAATGTPQTLPGN